MDNREAIEALRDLLDTTREYPHLDGMTMFGDAIELAIAALEKQEKALEQEFNEWCPDCKEYDKKNHCCHRFTKVIRQTVEECKREYANKEWIPVTERPPEMHKDVLVTDREVSDVYVSYYCGGGYWNTDTGGANNRIIAWRPLPKPYKAEEEE